MAKVQTSAGMTKKKNVQINLSVQSVGVFSGLVMGCIFTGQIKWCASVLMRGRTQQNQCGADMENDNRHNRTINNTKESSRTSHRRTFKSRHQTGWFTSVCGSWFCCVESQTTPSAFSSVVLRSLQWRLPPSLITTVSICRWFFPFYPLFLCSSLSIPALSVLLWGVLIFHPTSNHHIDRLTGRPVGGLLEHAALAVVLLQAEDELTTFIFPQNDTDVRRTKKKIEKKNQLSGLWFQHVWPQSSFMIVPEHFLLLHVLMGFGSLFDRGHICKTTPYKLVNKIFDQSRWK